MRIRTLTLAGVALAVSAAIAYSATKPEPKAKGPVMSALNLPWPAKVQKKQPKFPPALSPEQEARTFHMPPGYQVELVAAEPLVVDPVFAEFDGNGRLWVVEMQGYAVGKPMVNMTEPVGDIAILEDTDGDGIFDKRTVFQDKLVLPRALKILDHNCALIGEPPNLVKSCDTNGDLVADTKEVIKDGFGRVGNIEHAANGLFWGMDNTINISEHNYNAVPKDGGGIEIVPNLVRGQWGITQNDAGLIFRDVNTDPLFVDYIPAKYFTRNPDVTRTRGLYENLVDQEKSAVWPVRPTLGVNRGYRPEVPRPDGSAYYYQGVSSPLLYRGDALPMELYGNALVVDSPTNLVHLLKVNTDAGGLITATDYWAKGEFLASTDERFRPVMMTPHWDGSILVVDMYRGVSQDEPIQTDYLKNYIMQHRLWEGIHNGRIWRIVYKGMKPARAKPAMIDETPAQLVAHLSDANGWWRDTAQQLLVQRNDKSVVPALNALATSAPDARTRTQAIWTLSGMNALDAQTVSHALDDASADVRLAGVRGAETFLAKGQMLDAVLKRAGDANAVVRHQVAASLGELPPAARLAPVVDLLRRHGDDAIAVDAAVSGLKGMEADALAQLIAQPGANADPVEMLAGAAGKSRNVAQVNQVIGFAVDEKQPAPLRLAMLNGVNTGLIGIDARRFGSNVAGGKAGGGIVDEFARARPQVKPLALPAEPVALIALTGGSGELATVAKTVVDDLTWPGKPVPPAPKNTRTPEEDKLFAVGRVAYETNCTGCHQAHGEGQAHTAAALAGSQIVNGRPDMALRVLLNGKDGKIGEMPPLGQSLSDNQLAGVLTYIRGSFGNTATPIHPALAKEFRQLYAFRKKPWTDTELQKQPR
ncbi:MAG: dehydrogenase [Alphaproteobacteria bacterium]|nr:dehydrogenase [Alphaproteobacteria bacterium]